MSRSSLTITSETSILIRMSGNGRRGRRLTLAPAACRALRPSAQFMEVGGEDDEEADDRSCKEGRAALSRAVALAADACIRPKPIHGVSSSTAIPFKFWVQDNDSDLDEEDGHGEPPLADVTGKRVIPPTTDDEPSTPEFIKEALEAGFTLELLSRAENAFNSGSTPSSSDLKLANSIVSKMVERKTDGRPWQGPLTPPRVSPPRTFGDAIAAATYQRRSSSHRRPTRTSRPVGSPARSGPAGKTTNSNYFESPEFQDLDPLFPPLPRTMLPVSAACVTMGATEKSAQGFPGLAEHVVLGPGKIFRPTIGLRAFFRRTGTRVIHKHRVPPKTPPSPSTTPTRPSFAEVVREGKSMAAPGAGSGGDLGGRGGGRGAAFNPGFQPGFDPGFAGRGRGRDQFHPRG